MSPLCMQKRCVRLCAEWPGRWKFPDWCYPAGESGSTEPLMQCLHNGQTQPYAHLFSMFFSQQTHKQKARQFSLSVSLTIIKVKHSWVFGQTRVKICHQRGDVLSGCEQSVDYISSVNEACERKTSRGCHQWFICNAHWDIHNNYSNPGWLMGQRSPHTNCLTHSHCTSFNVICELTQIIKNMIV